jgi:endonuclease/exonuclease/phosphatase (EEP) superfamily protein YafD
VTRLSRILAVLHLLLVLAAMLVFALVGERSPRLIFFVYLPRAIFLAPLIITVPLLWHFSRRWLLLPAVTALVVVWPLMGLHFGHERDGQRALRVLSWQVWYGAGDAETLRREVDAADPDVVIFQAAAHNADRVLQGGRFPHYLHEDVFVIASRWPVKVAGEGPWVSNAVHRPWVQFEVSAPFGKVQAIGVHAQSIRGSIQNRKGLREAMLRNESFGGDLERLDEHVAGVDRALRKAGPFAFASGDFNAPDGGAVLRDRFDDFTDAWPATNFGYGWTFPANKRVLPAWLRLDRFYVAPGLVPLRSRVLKGPASDHAGLLVDLAVK